MKRKNTLILVGLVVAAAALIWYFSAENVVTDKTISIEAKQGEFVIEVTTTGELEARSSENIMGPNANGLRNARIHRYTIEDIVPDGTVVDSGQWVATIDRSDLENQIRDQELEVEKLETQFIKTQLDTTLTLRSARDELVNLKYQVEEKQIIVDQSLYEPPATQRQVKIDLEKTERSYKQTLQNYSIKQQQSVANMREVATNLEKARRVLKEFADLKKEFLITAPKSGMVNYKRDWNGQKLGAGDQISSWENVVAILPNLSAMNSRTYVNEIDISKVKIGQEAIVQIDAFPDKSFTGQINEVANMGEQMRNSNAKVFEVMIYVDGFDSILRPSMTTKNSIITEVIDSVVFIPIEAVNTIDSISFVYARSGKRQQVVPGKSSETDIIIRAGLQQGDEVYLIPPEGADQWSLRRLDQATLDLFKEVKTVEDTVDHREKRNGQRPNGRGRKQGMGGGSGAQKRIR
ncbi:MAG: RND transporter [Bacteroidetes bacterium CG18_big_fil_WC_8_21_14_2_50_41_14]|nr:MAG: RND transporter [Bacteroidetes bacterium CG18_big_fil_WC_8_21_14_2_50_41_14]PJB56627.1 MAG: RND transporter [Bacteroidetes bacterium CG_4_9_14_3_um_filter_41_19]